MLYFICSFWDQLGSQILSQFSALPKAYRQIISVRLCPQSPSRTRSHGDSGRMSFSQNYSFGACGPLLTTTCMRITPCCLYLCLSLYVSSNILNLLPLRPLLHWFPFVHLFFFTLTIWFFLFFFFLWGRGGSSDLSMSVVR